MLKLAIWAIGSLGKLGKMGDLGKMGKMGSLDLIFEYFRNFWNHSGDSRITQAIPCRIILEIISSVPTTTYDHFGKILFKFALTQSDLRYSLIVSDVIQNLPVKG
jgi:hypothetical protein